MKKKLLKQALLIAKRELRDHPEFLRHPHWTFIIQEGQIVEWATNNAGNPPTYFGYRSDCKRHAELVAYRRARGLFGGDKCFDIINIRLNRQAELKISAPCLVCWNWLQAVGCRKAIYSLTGGGWGEMR